MEPSTVKLLLPQMFPVVPRWDGERDHHLKSLGWRVWGAHGNTREPLGLGTVKAEEAPFHVTSLSVQNPRESGREDERS